MIGGGRLRCGLYGALAVVLLAWLPVAKADDTGRGLEAFQKGDLAAAHGFWLQAAEAGDGQAMFLLSDLYRRGIGVEQNQRTALKWLESAAKRGYALASYNLGGLYLNGIEVESDPAQAAIWWRRAAVQGLPQAQYNLGSLYYRGLGVERDHVQARWWYQQAAEQGSERAKAMLSRLTAQAPLTIDNPPPAAALKVAPNELAATPGGLKTAKSVAADPTILDRLSALALGPDWLRRQPGDHFTVQVFASQDVDAIHKLLTTHRFSRQVAVYAFMRNGQRWYGVVFGRFADVTAAKQGMTELPESLHKGKPWVRRIQDLITIMESRDG